MFQKDPWQTLELGNSDAVPDMENLFKNCQISDNTDEALLWPGNDAKEGMRAKSFFLVLKLVR